MVGSLEELNQLIKEIIVKRNIIAVYEKDIISKEKLFSEILERLKETQLMRIEELEKLEKTKITISLGDLLDELSYLSGVLREDISVKVDTKISFAGKRSMDEMINLYKKVSEREKTVMQVRIKDSSEKNRFNYYIYFPLDMDEVQADGRRLVEYLVPSNYAVFDGYDYTHLVVCGDIKNLNCHFSVKDLELDDKFGSWYPSELIRMAIINCINKKKNHKNVMGKVKERKRD